MSTGQSKLVMRGAALIVLGVLAGACGAEKEASRQECFSIDDCGGDQVCFLATCVDPGFSIQSAQAEMVPPSSSPYLPQQTLQPLDLRHGYQTLSLVAAVTYQGTLVAGGEPQSGGGRLLATTDGAIAGRLLSRETVVSGDGGFSLRVVPGTYDLRFEPFSLADSDAPKKPPFDYDGVPILGSTSSEQLPYPTSFVQVSGVVRYTDENTVGASQALITAEAETADGFTVGATDTLTDAQGAYTLLFPPGAQFFRVTVRPGQNPLVPTTELTLERKDGAPDELEDIVLGVAQRVPVSALLEDQNGAAVAGATVLFKGVVGAAQGLYEAQVQSGVDGSVAEVLVYPGRYNVFVVPQKAQPYALTLHETDVADAGELLVTVREKVHVSGHVRTASGAPVGGARIVLTLRGSPTQREYTTTSASDGSYGIDVDPGTPGDEAEYEVFVDPERTTGLPRYHELLKVADTNMTRELSLYAPTLVYGQVRDPGGEPLADVTVAFYSTELGDESKPLLVGLGQTSSEGEFVVPLPTPTVP